MKPHVPVFLLYKFKYVCHSIRYRVLWSAIRLVAKSISTVECVNFFTESNSDIAFGVLKGI
jgi:hypothetical protein